MAELVGGNGGGSGQGLEQPKLRTASRRPPPMRLCRQSPRRPRCACSPPVMPCQPNKQTPNPAPTSPPTGPHGNRQCRQTDARCRRLQASRTWPLPPTPARSGPTAHASRKRSWRRQGRCAPPGTCTGRPPRTGRRAWGSAPCCCRTCTGRTSGGSAASRGRSRGRSSTSS
eukprot:6965237-Alexandrium_andersonii.AAC.1